MSFPEADVLLGERYRLLDRIAGGGMGEVWRAQDEVLGRQVAVKILRREYAEDATFLARFRAEARHSAGLSHHGVAAVYDFGEGTPDGGGSPFLVMENVPGQPLSALIEGEGALGVDRTLDVVGQAASALQAAHDAGLIHRDVKPGNILVTPAGEVKITDFGIARAAHAVPLTQTGAIMGTAYYVSPEQATGATVTPASDIYSLGVVAYECLSGRRPFAGDTPVNVVLAQVRDEPPELPATVPAPVASLVMRMLAKEPADRPSSAGAVAAMARELRDATAPALAPTRQLTTVGAAAASTPAAGPSVDTASRGSRRFDDTDPGFALPSPAPSRHWLPYVVALVLFGLLFLTLRACADDPATERTAAGTGASTAAEPTAPTTVDVAEADYLRRPVDEVRSELADLGLRVEVVETAGGGEVGTVKQVAPTGPVDVGGMVRLEVVSAPPEEADDGDDDAETEDGKADKPTKGKGNGKSRGNGKKDD